MLFKVLFLPLRLLSAVVTFVLWPWYLRWIFRLPWPLTLCIAAALAYGASLAFSDWRTQSTAYETALAAPPPPVVHIDRFVPSRHMSPSGEVRVTGLIWAQDRLGTFEYAGKEETVIPVFTPDGVLGGGVIFSDRDRGNLLNLLAGGPDRPDTASWEVTVHGAQVTKQGRITKALAVLETAQLTPEGEGLWITPFLEGRAKGLKGNLDGALIVAIVAGLLSAVFFWKVQEQIQDRRPAIKARKAPSTPSPVSSRPPPQTPTPPPVPQAKQKAQREATSKLATDKVLPDFGGAQHARPQPHAKAPPPAGAARGPWATQPRQMSTEEVAMLLAEPKPAAPAAVVPVPTAPVPTAPVPTAKERLQRPLQGPSSPPEIAQSLLLDHSAKIDEVIARRFGTRAQRFRQRD